MRGPRSTSLLLVLGLLGGCREAPVSVLLRIEAEAIPTPDELRLTVLGAGMVEVRDRRLPGAGKPTLPDSVVLYPRAPGALRVLVRALRGGGRVAEGTTAVEASADTQVSSTVTLRAAALPDRDGDGIPDGIDNCPDRPNPEQGACPTEAGADAPRRDLSDGPRVDRPALPLRDAPTSQERRLDLSKPKVDLPKPKVDLPRVDQKPKVDLPKPDLPKPKVDVTKPDLSKPDLPKPDLPGCVINSFGFDPVAHQPPAATVIYDRNGGITVKANVTCAVTATVSGPGNPAFDLNGSGVWQTSGTVVVGQNLRLRVTTSSTAGDKIAPTLTIGTRSASWSVTTCAGATCMVGAIGTNTGCNTPATRVHRWTCPGSTELIYAEEFTLQFSGTGLLTCPARATCEWEACGGNGWQTGTLACP